MYIKSIQHVHPKPTHAKQKDLIIEAGLPSPGSSKRRCLQASQNAGKRRSGWGGKSRVRN